MVLYNVITTSLEREQGICSKHSYMMQATLFTIFWMCHLLHHIGVYKGKHTYKTPLENLYKGKCASKTPVANLYKGKCAFKTPVANLYKGKCASRTPVANLYKGKCTSRTPVAIKPLQGEMHCCSKRNALLEHQ